MPALCICMHMHKCMRVRMHEDCAAWRRAFLIHLARVERPWTGVDASNGNQKLTAQITLALRLRQIYN